MEVKDTCASFGLVAVPAKTMIIDNPLSMIIEAGTNGYQGSDHGCITFFRFRSETINDFSISVLDQGKLKDIPIPCSGFEIRTEGDFELDCMINSLEFITATLKEQRERS